MIGCGEVFTVTIDDEGDLWGFGDCPSLGIRVPQKLGLTEIVTVSCGYGFIICADRSGNAWGLGSNPYGQLGNGSFTSSNEPQKIAGLPPIQSVHCGDNHTICITNESTVWSFGRNITGQLGLGFFKDSENSNHEDILVPTKVKMHGIISASCGYRHTILLCEEGNVYAAGESDFGQLGLGDELSYHTFTQIPNLPPIKAISCSEKHSLFLDYEGYVYGTGNSECGQLGHKKAKQFKPIRIDGLVNITKIASGKAHILCVDQDGVLWGLGSNLYNQLGEGSSGIVKFPIDDVTMIGTRSFHNIIQDSRGSIWVCGKNNCKQLGIAQAVSEITKLPDNLSNILTTRSMSISRAKSARK